MKRTVTEVFWVVIHYGTLLPFTARSTRRQMWDHWDKEHESREGAKAFRCVVERPRVR